MDPGYVIILLLLAVYGCAAVVLFLRARSWPGNGGRSGK